MGAKLSQHFLQLQHRDSATIPTLLMPQPSPPDPPSSSGSYLSTSLFLPNYSLSPALAMASPLLTLLTIPRSSAMFDDPKTPVSPQSGTVRDAAVLEEVCLFKGSATITLSCATVRSRPHEMTWAVFSQMPQEAMLTSSFTTDARPLYA